MFGKIRTPLQIVYNRYDNIKHNIQKPKEKSNIFHQRIYDTKISITFLIKKKKKKKLLQFHRDFTKFQSEKEKSSN